MQTNLFEVPNHNTPLIYPGGKRRARKHFYKFLPTGTETLVSPFVGGAAIELLCSANGIKVIASDNFEPLINFWIQFQQDADAVIDEAVRLSPLPSDERWNLYENSIEPQCTDLSGNVLSDFDRAARFFVINRFSYSGLTLATTPHTEDFVKPNTKPQNFENFRGWWNNNIEFRHQDYRKTLSEFDGHFMFIDPPYVNCDNLYGSMSKGFGEFDHHDLFARLSQLKNKWILCYKKHELITTLYRDYNIFEYSLDHGMARRGGKKKKDEVSKYKGTELFIMNY